MSVKIGEKIKKVISDAGLSQTDLAKCLGVTPQQVSHWINNKGFPSLDKFISLVEVTGKDANFFLGFPSRIVLDPFVGSGSTAAMAKKLGRDFIGIDISKEYCELAERRLQEVK